MPSSLPPISAETVAEAKKLLNRGFSWGVIGPRLGVSSYRLRIAMDHNYREKRREINKRCWENRKGERPIKNLSLRVRREPPMEWQERYGVRPSDTVGLLDRPNVPDRVWDELQRVQEAPRTLGMELLGDPLPGRSALDKRKPHIVVANP